MTSSPLLSPTNDLVFKLLLERSPELLEDQLSAVFSEPVKVLRILNPGIPGNLSSEKLVLLDVLVELEHGGRVIIEMQVSLETALAERAVFYWARDYAQQLRRGEAYAALVPTRLVLWAIESLHPGAGFHQVFELRERSTGLLFSEALGIHVLQVAELSGEMPSPEENSSRAAWLWGKMFTVTSQDELAVLFADSPVMQAALRQLVELSEDPEVARLARERDEERILNDISRRAGERHAREQGFEDGREQGREEARVTILLRQLTRKFGPLPGEVATRVRSLDGEKLGLLAEEVLFAASLDELLQTVAS